VFVLQLAGRILTTRNENIWHPGDYILDGGYSDYGLLGCDAVWNDMVTDVFKQRICQTTRLYNAVYHSLSLFVVCSITFLINKDC
jgi:hypothetical protein